jgi:hypothetical protein
MARLDLLSIVPPSFSRVLFSYHFSEKSSEIKFLEKFQNFFLNFYVKNRAERHLGDLRGTHHATSPPGGAAQAWSRPPMVRRGPLALHLPLHPHFLLSPKISQHLAQTRVLAALHRDFSISLLSPSLLLRFGAIVLRYVSPSIVQV